MEGEINFSDKSLWYITGSLHLTLKVGSIIIVKFFFSFFPELLAVVIRPPLAPHISSFSWSFLFIEFSVGHLLVIINGLTAIFSCPFHRHHEILVSVRALSLHLCGVLVAWACEPDCGVAGVKKAGVLALYFQSDEFHGQYILSWSFWLASDLSPVGLTWIMRTLFCRCGLTGTVTTLVWTFPVMQTR